MNPEVKEKWVAALRSGEYKQGRGKLRDENNKFCCLGVLCDLAIKDGADVGVLLKNGIYRYDLQAASPPPSVREWAGLRSANPVLGGVKIMDRNDVLRDTFKQLADRIENEL